MGCDENKLRVKNKYVLFLDVLGFSHLVSKNSIENLKRIYNSEIHQTANMIPLITSTKFGRAMKVRIETSTSGILRQVQQSEINMHIMSDTVIAWTNDDEIESLVKLCQFSATYLAISLSLGLPHRGAISKGELELIGLPLNGQIQQNAVGSGIVRAHDLESKQDWMGCVLDKTCTLNSELQKLLNEPNCPIVQYDVPFKNAQLTDIAINWTVMDEILTDTSKEYISLQFSRYNKPTENIEAKIDNTYLFLEKMLNR